MRKRSTGATSNVPPAIEQSAARVVENDSVTASVPPLKKRPACSSTRARRRDGCSPRWLLAEMAKIPALIVVEMRVTVVASGQFAGGKPACEEH